MDARDVELVDGGGESPADEDKAALLLDATAAPDAGPLEGMTLAGVSFDVPLPDGGTKRLRDCHSALPPPLPLGRRFNMDGEGMSAK